MFGYTTSLKARHPPTQIVINSSYNQTIYQVRSPYVIHLFVTSLVRVWTMAHYLRLQCHIDGWALSAHTQISLVTVNWRMNKTWMQSLRLRMYTTSQSHNRTLKPCLHYAHSCYTYCVSSVADTHSIYVIWDPSSDYMYSQTVRTLRSLMWCLLNVCMLFTCLWAASNSNTDWHDVEIVRVTLATLHWNTGRWYVHKPVDYYLLDVKHNLISYAHWGPWWVPICAFQTQQIFCAQQPCSRCMSQYMHVPPVISIILHYRSRGDGCCLPRCFQYVPHALYMTPATFGVRLSTWLPFSMCTPQKNNFFLCHKKTFPSVSQEDCSSLCHNHT